MPATPERASIDSLEGFERLLLHYSGNSIGVARCMPRGQPITSVFDESFRDLGDDPGMARVKANFFVNTWQGAIVVAGAGEGLKHIGRVFRYLKEIVPLSC
jgi:hypothetical protein